MFLFSYTATTIHCIFVGSVIATQSCNTTCLDIFNVFTDPSLPSTFLGMCLFIVLSHHVLFVLIFFCVKSKCIKLAQNT